MKKSPKRIEIDGYKLPNGAGGVAIRHGCELIRNNPGIRQTELLTSMLKISDLNSSTAGWLVTPGKTKNTKNPAGILWDRKKDNSGHFCCYPNEATMKVESADELVKEIRYLKLEQLEPFDTNKIIDVSTTLTRDPHYTAVVIGFALIQKNQTIKFKTLESIRNFDIKKLTYSCYICVEVFYNGNIKLLHPSWLRSI